MMSSVRFRVLAFSLGVLGMLAFAPMASAQSTGTDFGQNSTSTDLAASSSSDISVTPLRRGTPLVLESSINQTATTLNMHLAQGTLQDVNLVAVTVAPELQRQLAPLFMTEASDEGVELESVMVERGVKQTHARALAASVQGLTVNNTVELGQMVMALDAFNTVVDNAPAEFLASPPQEFLVVRGVLTSLVSATQ